MLFPNLSRVGSLQGASSGGGAHRYWRITNVVVSSPDTWQPTELQLWTDASTRADNASTTLTTTSPITFGTLPRFVDGDISSYVEFFPMSTAYVFKWDFVSSTAVTGFKICARGGGGAANAATAMRLEYSDDNSAWTLFGNATGIAFSTLLSAFIPFL